MTFRYFYDGAYREVYVPAGGRIVLDVATAGVFPFTAVGDNYLASGSFYGGAPAREVCTTTCRPTFRPRPDRAARPGDGPVTLVSVGEMGGSVG